MAMQWVIVALVTGCNSQNKVEPVDATKEAPAEQPAAEPAVAAAVAMPERGDDAVRKSKNGSLVHTIDGMDVEVSFGRPEARGRDLFGDLVPYGSVWRTGADEATAIKFDKDVTVQGQPLASGVYAVFTIPGETEWTVIFNGEAKQWGAYKYDEGKDVLRVTTTATEAEAVEAMDIQGTDDGIVIRWGTVAVPVTIAVPGAADAAPEGGEAAAEGTEAEAAEGTDAE